MSTSNNDETKPPSPGKRGGESLKDDGEETAAKKIKSPGNSTASIKNVGDAGKAGTGKDDEVEKFHEAMKKAAALKDAVAAAKNERDDDDAKTSRIASFKLLGHSIIRKSDSLSGQMKTLVDSVHALHPPDQDRNPEAMKLRRSVHNLQQGIEWIKKSTELAISNDENQAAIDRSHGIVDVYDGRDAAGDGASDTAGDEASDD